METGAKIKADFLEREISIMECLQRLRRVMGSIPVDLNQAIREVYGESISLAEADRLVDLAREGELTRLRIAQAAPGKRQVASGE